MAFIDDLEKIVFGEANTTDHNELNEFFKLANESKNISLNPSLLGDGGSHSWGRVFLIFAYGVLIVISMFGNTLVCHVIFKEKQMRTITNFFIANLAIADLLLTCINVPFNIARNLLDEWPFGSVMCHLLNFSLMTSVYVNTYTLLGIALDRQRVLLSPFSPKMSRRIGHFVLGLIWLLAIGLSLPFGVYNKVQTVDFLFEKAERCAPAYPSPTDRWKTSITLMTFFLQYLIPLTVIGVTYGRIVRKLWVRTHVGAVTEHQQLSQQKAKRKSIKMMIVIVTVFAICWLPLNLYQLLANFHPNVEVFHYNSTSFFICHWIAISSTCYNPFLYFWLNERFRGEVKSRFKCCFPRPKRVHPGIDIDGVLLRSDRAFLGKCSKSSTSKQRVCARLSNSAAEKYKIHTDRAIHEQCEQLTETPDHSEGSGLISSVLETVPEVPEMCLTEITDDHLGNGHVNGYCYTKM